MFWLLVFGLLHFYFIWFGDILAALRADRHDRSFLPRPRRRALVIWGDRPGHRPARCCSRPSPAACLPRRSAAAAPGAERRGGRSNGATCSESFAPLTGQALAESWRCSAAPIPASSTTGWSSMAPSRSRRLSSSAGRRSAYMLFGMAALKTASSRGEWAPRALSQGRADRLRHRHPGLCRCSPGCSSRDGLLASPMIFAIVARARRRRSGR